MKRISDLKVPELHDELTKRGLAKKGKKQELIQVSFLRPFSCHTHIRLLQVARARQETLICHSFISPISLYIDKSNQ